MCNSGKKEQWKEKRKACHTDNHKMAGVNRNIAGFSYEQLSPSPIEQQ